jgi:hypothetical protein
MKRGNKGQMQLSFGMIFSIILIIIFVSFAFYAILKLLEFQRSAQIANFINNFESDINSMWSGGGGSQERSYTLPSRIKKICFIDKQGSGLGIDSEIFQEVSFCADGNNNLCFYPYGSSPEIFSRNIKNIDIEKITLNRNPFCIENNGKVSMTIKMGIGESLVVIEE